MLRIGVSVTPVYDINHNLKNIDGIGTYTANLCCALKQQNIQVKEIYFKNINEQALKPKITSTVENFIVTETPIFSLLPGNFYSQLKEKIDLLHITDYLAPRVKGIPTISFIHDAIMLKFPQWLAGSAQINYLKGYILKKLSQQADHIITCSQASIADIVDYWKIPESKISVIYNGINPIWFKKVEAAAQQAILQQYKIFKPFYLTVGTIQPRKNLERIINAYLNLSKSLQKNYTLVIVGKDHAALTPPALLDKIHQLENTGQLLWLKYVPFEDLLCLYQSAQALLFPSLAEGFGFPILEGFASKIPVITSDSGSTAEIGGSAAYLVDPYSEESIAHAMSEISEKPDLRNQLIQRGLDRIKYFTWEKCAQETIKVYRKFV